MTHIMVDLETWGTTPGSDIRSIGAVVFDPVAGTLGNEFYVNVVGGEKVGLTRDPETEEWWADQSEEARGAFAEAMRNGNTEARLDHALLLIEDRDPSGGRATLDALLKDLGAKVVAAPAKP